jgi:hypothetical protein
MEKKVRGRAKKRQHYRFQLRWAWQLGWIGRKTKKS